MKEQKYCYIEDVNGGYICSQEDANFFLNEYESTNDAGGSICISGTIKEIEEELGSKINLNSIWTKVKFKNN